MKVELENFFLLWRSSLNKPYYYFSRQTEGKENCLWNRWAPKVRSENIDRSISNDMKSLTDRSVFFFNNAKQQNQQQKLNITHFYQFHEKWVTEQSKNLTNTPDNDLLLRSWKRCLIFFSRRFSVIILILTFVVLMKLILVQYFLVSFLQLLFTFDNRATAEYVREKWLGNVKSRQLWYVSQFI